MRTEATSRPQINRVSFAEPYRPRQIRFLEQWSFPSWRVKVYTIVHANRTLPETSVIEHVKKTISKRLAELASEQHYGAAIVIMHMARENDIVSLTWWTWENVLQQVLFIGPPGKPAKLCDVTSMGLLACVWELEVHNFERCAWMEAVLKNSVKPDLDAYLRQHLVDTVI